MSQIKLTCVMTFILLFVSCFLFNLSSEADDYDSNLEILNNFLEPNKHSELCSSIYENNIEKVRLLLNKKNIDRRSCRIEKKISQLKHIDKIYLSPQILALELNRKEILALLIKTKYQKMSFQEDALFYSIKQNNLNKIDLLLSLGKDVNSLSSYDWASTSVALKNGNMKLFKYLLKKGADKSLITKKADEIYGKAITEDYFDIFHYLLEEEKLNPKNNSLCCGENACCKHILICASAFGSYNIFSYLIEHNANVDQTDKKGYTALSLAIEKYFDYTNSWNMSNPYYKKKSANFKKIIITLLNKNVDINKKSALQEYPIIQSSKAGDVELGLLFLKHGAKGNVHSHFEYDTPAILYAAEVGKLELVQALHNSGADVNAQDSYGDSALTYASGNGFLSVVKYLLNNGANIELQTKDGDTALIAAAEQGQLETFKFLLQQGANLSHKNRFGEDALRLSKRNQRFNIVSFIQQLRAK